MQSLPLLHSLSSAQDPRQFPKRTAMTPVIAKAIFALLIVGWYAIRVPHEWRARRTPVKRSARDYRELAVILIAILGLGTLPLLYIATGFPQIADYPFN